MCDYSLMAVPNRLAIEGEHLITHRFSTGVVGTATPDDVWNVRTAPATGSFWKRLRAVLNNLGARHCVTAVCIPPGARLRLEGIPRRVQRQFGISGTEAVTFTQVSAESNQFRDAVRFENGREILIQDLSEGTRIEVLDLSIAAPRQHIEPGYAYTLIPHARNDE